jgi:hypothetical protein
MTVANTSLLQYGNNYGRIKFYSKGPKAVGKGVQKAMDVKDYLMPLYSKDLSIDI